MGLFNKKESPKSLEEAVQIGIDSGIGNIVKTRPRFKDYEKFIRENVDYESLNHMLKGIDLSSIKPEDRARYIASQVASYVQRASSLTPYAQAVLINNPDPMIVGRNLKREIVEMDDYLSGAFKQVHNFKKELERTGGKPDEEVIQILGRLQQYHFDYAALNSMLINKRITLKQMREMKAKLAQGVKTDWEDTQNKILSRIAAGIFGLLGLGLIFSIRNYTNATTGAVIGNSTNTLGAGIFGLAFLVVAGILLFKGMKK